MCHLLNDHYIKAQFENTSKPTVIMRKIANNSTGTSVMCDPAFVHQERKFILPPLSKWKSFMTRTRS
jgi:hypothetical protein